MTTLYCIFFLNKKLFCLFQVFKMFKVDKTRTLSYWVECQLSCLEKTWIPGWSARTQGHKKLFHFKIGPQGPPRGGPLKSTQNLQNFEFVYFLSMLLPPISTIYFWNLFLKLFCLVGMLSLSSANFTTKRPNELAFWRRKKVTFNLALKMPLFWLTNVCWLWNH